MTQNNLATAYSDRLTGDKAANLEAAIECYKLALEVRTREDFREKWATTQNNLAIAYSDRLTGDKAANLEAAIECYKLALEVRTPINFPTDCLQTARNWGNCAFTQGWWQQAIDAYSLAVTALENIRSQSNEDRQQSILSSNIHIYENLIQAAINHNQLPLALETVERVRSKRLVELMATPDLYRDGKIPAPVTALLDKLDDLQRQIDKLRPDNGGSNSEQKQAAVRSRAQLAAISEDIAALEPAPN
jgi:tetratricopeptide (TPR) repeat protein